MKFLPSRSSLLHLRFAFSLLLLPVFIFALSQVSAVYTVKAWVVFIVWHLFIYPASNGYNSYFDKDQESIALLRKPPEVDKSLYYSSLFIELSGILAAAFVNTFFAVCVTVYGILSKLYSHPSVRLKKYPLTSFLLVFLFQGAFVYWASYAAVSGQGIAMIWNTRFCTAGLICSFLIGASYPLTQVYQHREDRTRGDRTLSLLLGIKNTFLFSGLLFISGALLLYLYWYGLGMIYNFFIFLVCMIPVLAVFLNWFLKVWKNEKEADYKNMSRMTFLSGISMLIYFLIVWMLK